MYYVIIKDIDKSILNYHIEKTIQDLKKNNLKLDKNIFGDSTANFDKCEGNIGYLSVALDNKLKPILPIPEKGKSYKIIFKTLSINDQIGTVTIKDNINDANKLLIKSYKLFTIYLDSSKKYYQVFYKVKYK